MLSPQESLIDSHCRVQGLGNFYSYHGPDTSTRNHRGHRAGWRGVHPADSRVHDHGVPLSLRLAGKD